MSFHIDTDGTRRRYSFQVQQGVGNNGNNTGSSVVSMPVVTGPTVAGIGSTVTLTATASSLLAGGSVSSFTWVKPGNVQVVVPAVNGKSSVSFTANGNDGDVLITKVYARDNAGNKSQEVSHAATLTLIAVPDVTNLTTNIPSTIAAGESVSQLSITGAMDPDGGSVTYGLTLPAGVTASKSTGLVNNELFSITAAANATVNPTADVTITVTASGGGTNTFTKRLAVAAAKPTAKPDVTNLTTNIPSTIAAGESVSQLSITGAMDPDGGSVTYGLTLPAGVTASKMTGLTNGELFSITAAANVTVNPTANVTITVTASGGGTTQVVRRLAVVATHPTANEVSWTTSGSYYWTVPENVYSVSALTVDASGGDVSFGDLAVVGRTATHADATLTSSSGFSLINPRNPGAFGVSNGVNGIAAYDNDIPTIPGSQIPVVVPAPDGGVRVIWGNGKSFPDNASSTVVPVGEMSWITPGTYSWTVPDGVTAGSALVVDGSGGDVRFGDLAVVESRFQAMLLALPANAYWQSITYGNGVFVAVAYNSSIAATSPDGITWTQRSLPANAFWQSVTYGNGVFVAVATSGSNIAATSPDGITWTLRALPANAYWQSITYGNGVFVAVATSLSKIAATSPDGITWTLRSLPTTTFWQSITYGNGVFVAVTPVNGNTNSRAAISPDGITWTERGLPGADQWQSITYGNGLFVAVSHASGSAATSPDGITWTQRTLPATASWQSVTYGNGLFVAVSHASSIAATSPDGITWTQRSLPANAYWQSITYGNGVFVAVATNGSNLAATLTISPTATHADATLTSSNGFSLTAPTNSGSYGVSSGVAAYDNDMPLTPGAQITVNVPGPDGAARVIWGAGRSFPSNAASSGTQIGIVLVAEGGGAGQWQRVDGYFNPVNYPFGGAFFNSHPTYAGIVDQTIDGQAMVKVPKFWFKTGTVPSGTYVGKRYWMISDRAAPGFAVHPAFMNYGAEVAQYWVGKYQGTNDGGTKLGSVAGLMPLVSIDFPTMQTRATNRNTGGVAGFGLWNIYQLSAIQTLALIEMGGSDSQTPIGQGRVNASSAANVDAADVAQATWRGVVGLWGNVWQMVDGLQTDASSKYKIWDKNGNKTYKTTSLTAPAGYYPITMATATGTDYDLATVFAPETTSPATGSGTYGDYFWQSANCVAYHGGIWGNGAGAGLFSLSGGAASSTDAAVGGRLAKV